MPATAPKKRSLLSKAAGAIVILAIIAIGGWYTYQHFQHPAAPTLAEQRAAEDAKVKSITDAVGKLMALPSGEEPLVFEIRNPEQLSKQQPFFKDAVSGDELLVYQKASKAIIYSPSRNTIVNAGPLQFTAPTAPAKTESVKTATQSTSTATKKTQGK